MRNILKYISAKFCGDIYGLRVWNWVKYQHEIWKVPCLCRLLKVWDPIVFMFNEKHIFFCQLFLLHNKIISARPITFQPNIYFSRNLVKSQKKEEDIKFVSTGSLLNKTALLHYFLDFLPEFKSWQNKMQRLWFCFAIKSNFGLNCYNQVDWPIVWDFLCSAKILSTILAFNTGHEKEARWDFILQPGWCEPNICGWCNYKT